MNNTDLETFVRNIINEKNITVSSEEVKSQLVSDMMQRMLDIINRELIAALADDKVDELNTLLDRGASESEVQEFIASSLPDSKDIVSRTMLRFRNEYLA